MTRFLLIRHAQASGQSADASLTPQGQVQALHLADQLAAWPITHIVASPYVRAVATIEPLAQRLGLPIRTDSRLVERVLSDAPLDDWQAALRETFIDLDRRYAGGETSREAMQRAVAVLRECAAQAAPLTAIVTHGNLLSLLLRYFDPQVDFATWQQLRNPDVFLLELAPERADGELVASQLYRID
jgi:2,3-bisphosphoglycerate-dependent phosphoglycerate mutase